MKPLFDDKNSDAVSDRPSTPSSSPVAAPVAVPAAAVAVPAARPAENVRLITVDEIDQLGATQGTRIAAFSQQILASVRASDADQFGDKLNELIATAKGSTRAAPTRAGCSRRSRGCSARPRRSCCRNTSR